MNVESDVWTCHFDLHQPQADKCQIVGKSVMFLHSIML